MNIRPQPTSDADEAVLTDRDKAVLRILATATDELYTRQVIEETGFPAKTTTKILIKLLKLKWVHRPRRGSYRYYQITDLGVEQWRTINESTMDSNGGETANA